MITYKQKELNMPVIRSAELIEKVKKLCNNPVFTGGIAHNYFLSPYIPDTDVETAIQCHANGLRRTIALVSMTSNKCGELTTNEKKLLKL